MVLTRTDGASNRRSTTTAIHRSRSRGIIPPSGYAEPDLDALAVGLPDQPLTGPVPSDLTRTSVLDQAATRRPFAARPSPSRVRRPTRCDRPRPFGQLTRRDQQLSVRARRSEVSTRRWRAAFESCRTKVRRAGASEESSPRSGAATYSEQRRGNPTRHRCCRHRLPATLAAPGLSAASPMSPSQDRSGFSPHKAGAAVLRGTHDATSPSCAADRPARSQRMVANREGRAPARSRQPLAYRQHQTLLVLQLSPIVRLAHADVSITRQAPATTQGKS